MTDEKAKQPKKNPRAPRMDMPRQDPQERAHNFYEVALGYDKEMAVAEAERCMFCKKPLCVMG